MARLAVQMDFRTILATPLLREGQPIGVLFPARGRRAVHRDAGQPGHHLRRPGGHRDRERAPVRRGPGAHERTVGGIGAADGDLGSAQRHQQLALPTAAGVRHHRRDRHASVPRRVFRHFPADQRAASCRRRDPCRDGFHAVPDRDAACARSRHLGRTLRLREPSHTHSRCLCRRGRHLARGAAHRRIPLHLLGRPCAKGRRSAP